MSKLVVLVTGGRDYTDARRVAEVMDALSTRADLTLIHGAARGADSLADQWATIRGIPVQRFPADWARFGRSAGIRRNEAMLRGGQPDLVVAFPGGRGTAHMVRIAREAGIKVRLVDDEAGEAYLAGLEAEGVQGIVDEYVADTFDPMGEADPRSPYFHPEATLGQASLLRYQLDQADFVAEMEAATAGLTDAEVSLLFS